CANVMAGSGFRLIGSPAKLSTFGRYSESLLMGLPVEVSCDCLFQRHAPGCPCECHVLLGVPNIPAYGEAGELEAIRLKATWELTFTQLLEASDGSSGAG